MRKSRVDGNQKQIVRELRAMGYSVRHTHMVRDGFPDIVIGRAGYNLLVEIKMPGEGLTSDEKDFFDSWNGAVVIGTSAQEIHEAFVRMMKGNL